MEELYYICILFQYVNWAAIGNKIIFIADFFLERKGI